jgi:2-methylaconitate cis-trans-isomerase PrpF
MRGGTSKAVVFARGDLPESPADWDPIFLAVLGSPDPYARQLDGMGVGLSSLSKVCVVGPPSRPDADLDYTFAQVSVSQPLVDYSGNCGNMSSAIGPYAVEEGLVDAPRDGLAVVRIHNTNTRKIIRSSFEVAGGSPVVDGDLVVDGVAGSGAPIRLDFLDPGGSGTGSLLPTSRPCDDLSVEDDRTVRASMVDASTPCVFVHASDFGVLGVEPPEVLEENRPLMHVLEETRRAASVRMGIAESVRGAAERQSIPKMALVSEPKAHALASGRELCVDEFEICVRMLSMGRPHRAVPITGAVCLAVAARLSGTVPASVLRPDSQALRIAHPSGVVTVDAKVTAGTPTGPYAEFGSVYRTARRLFEGWALYR